MSNLNISSEKKKALKLLKQAAGTNTTVQEQIASDVYCPNIIQQLDSAIGLMKAARKNLLAGHLDTCLLKKLSSNKQKTIQELLTIYNLNS
jgi:DNA-binding FrmR family transcriptional regulator